MKLEYKNIPVNEPLLNGNEKKYLNQCIDTGWISSEGPFIKEFEEKMAKQVGRKYGIAVSNGSVAIDAAILAQLRKQGDYFLLPQYQIAEGLNGDELKWQFLPPEYNMSIPYENY